ncbi:MAG: hypothetical protein FJ087_16355 [Deltaproteobacteria bacterium]|nr:hypothetical protein [Deltaproteobacteria bacterium]
MTMRTRWLVLLPAVLVGAAPEPDGIGTDLAANAKCLGCHAGVAAAWKNPSSHERVLDCATCHAVSGASGKGHADRPPCGRCHSEASHPTAATACGACHAVHGSSNAFLVRESIALPGGGTAAIRVTKPEGASNDGLARAGVAGGKAGTGLCEVCHAATAHYDAAGKGSAHSTKWCFDCHSHQAGMEAGASRGR